MLTFEENNKTLNDRVLKVLTEMGILATDLMSFLSKILFPERNSPFKLVEDLQSNRVNDLSINEKIPATPYNNLLTLPDTDKKFELA